MPAPADDKRLTRPIRLRTAKPSSSSRPEEDAAPAVPYASERAKMGTRCPKGVAPERWRAALADADKFLALWGRQAEAFGWPAFDLFDPPKPGIPGGLLWEIAGGRIILLSARTALVHQNRQRRRFRFMIAAQD